MRITLTLLIVCQLLAFEASAEQCSVQDCSYTGLPEPVRGPLIVDNIRVLAMNVEGQKEISESDGACEDRLETIGEIVADAESPYTIVGLNEVHPDTAITCDGLALVEGIQKNGEYGSGKHRWGHPDTGILTSLFEGGLALFSTSQFDWVPYNEHVHKYAFDPYFRTSTGFIFTQIQIMDDIAIDVYITHLHSKNSGYGECDRNCRYQELEELAKGIHERSELSGNPVLVMGDFNIDGPNPDPDDCNGNCGYSDIMDVLRNPRDLWMERIDPTPPGSTHKRRRIDYMFVLTDSFFSNSDYEIFLSAPDGIKRVDWKMDNGEPVSDHLGLSATLEIRERVSQPPDETIFEYAAKIICGKQEKPEDMRLARGFYATTVNIHNPGNDVKFTKKLALSYPPGGQKPGKVTLIAEDELKFEEALETDCMDIKERLFPNGFPTPYIEGFVLIQSEESLDVTAVYSTSSLNEEGRVVGHSSIEIEQVPERQKGKPKLPDLIPVLGEPGAPCLQLGNNFIVKVKNQGSMRADESKTKLHFVDLTSPPIIFNTGELDPAQLKNTIVPLPNALLDELTDGNHRYRITVDDVGAVPEENENNNEAVGECRVIIVD